MPGKWIPAPHAGTSKVALQSQLGVSGEIARQTPLEELWRYIGRSDPPIPADWSERYTRYFSEKTADNKKGLPAVNVSTICQSLNGSPVARRVDNVSFHTGLIVIDYDKIPAAPALASELKRCEHVLGTFVSPSGNGVKVIVPVTPIPGCVEDHKAAYEYVVKALKPFDYGCKVDDSGKDPVRLMFAYSHTPFRMGLNIDVVPVQWWPLETKKTERPTPTAVEDDSEMSDLEAHLRKLDLRDRKVWFSAMGAARTAGFSFEQWNDIASASGGYVSLKEQRDRWDEDVRSGKPIPPKTIFKIAKDQDKLTPSKQKRPVVATGGSKPSTSAKSPAKNSKPSKAKETPSSGESETKAAPDSASKSNHVLMAREFAKHCDKNNTPVRFWVKHYWLHYGEHGWGEDPDEVGLWNQLTRWAESPAGVELQAPLTRSGLESVERLVRRMVAQNDWDSDHRVGLPEKNVMTLNDDASVGIERGNWKTYISKRAGAMLGSGDTPEDALWERCISEWMPAVEVATYVQTLLGAALFGYAVETRAVLYIQSSSQYGKSTFLDAVRGAFGEYADVARAEAFTKRPGEDKLDQIARLQGLRLVMANEIPRDAPWNAARIKQLAGGEKILGKHLYQNSFTFMPEFLLVLSGNHDPYITGGESEGVKQRMRIVRWPKRGFSTPDRKLKDKLSTPAARAAILRWVVSGAMHYAAGGLPETPESMQAATNEYFETADWFVDYCTTLKFWKDEDDQSGKPYYIARAELTEHYKRWCTEEGITEARREDARNLNRMYANQGCKRSTHKINGKKRATWSGVKIIRHIDPPLLQSAQDSPESAVTDDPPY